MGTWGFQPLLAPWQVLVTAVALGVAGWLYYRTRDDALTAPKRVTLAGLRLAAFAIAVLILTGPVSRTEETLKRGRALTVLVDTSASMATADSGAKGKTARIDLAREALVEAASKLAKQYDFKVYSFDAKPSFLGQVSGSGEGKSVAEALQASGTATALGDALVEAAPRRRDSAVLVLSDGASNSGRAVSTAAETLAARGTKVFAVPVGRAGRPNVAIKRVLGPKLLLKDEPSAFFAEVAFAGGVTGSVKVSLKLGDKTLATAEAAPSGTPALVRLNFNAEGEGDVTYTVVADALPAEENVSDNRLDRTVKVAKEKLKVLYVEEEPRWEYRFLKNAILRDDRLSPKLLLRAADKGLAAASYNVTALPATRAEMFKEDVIVIGDVNGDFFLPKDLDNLRAFVSEGGGGLLFIAGPAFDPARYTPQVLGDLLPADGAGEAKLPANGVTLTLTDAGAASPALTLSADDQKEFWKTLPALRWIYSVRPRAGATVLAETVDGQLPVIVEEQFGRGRTMLIATDELWRWRREHGDEYIYRLWAQLVRYLGSRRLASGSAAGELTLASDRIAVGQSVYATAYLEDSLAMPLRAPSAEGVLEAPDSSRSDVAFSKSGEGAGLYRAEFPVAAPGKYTLFVKGQTGYLSQAFTVSSDPIESLSKEADLNTLEGLASTTGGKTLTTDKLSSILALFPPDAEKEIRIHVAPLWSSWWFLFPIVALLCIEWALRKKWDLA